MDYTALVSVCLSPSPLSSSCPLSLSTAVAALISIVISEVIADTNTERTTAWIEGAAILLAVVLVVIVTAINDWTKERKFRALQQRLECSSK